MFTRRFALAMITLAVLVSTVPHATFAATRTDATPITTAQVPNDPPFFDRSPPSGNDISTLDSTGSVGTYTSATIGADGLGLISYNDATNKDLKVAHCSDTKCSAATLTTLDSPGNVGTFTSITIGQDGLGLIAYYDLSNANLKVAHCSNVECTAATLATLDATGDVGKHTSITIGADGLALISYFDATNKDLKVAHCNDVACSSGTSIIADSAGSAGEYNSIALGRDGRAMISYYASSAGVKVAHCTDIACTTVTSLQPLDIGVYPPKYRDTGTFTTLSIGTDGRGIIGYYNTSATSLSIYDCVDLECKYVKGDTVDAPGNVGAYPSMTIGQNGLANFSYYDWTQGDVRIGICGSEECSSMYVNSSEVYPSFTPFALDSTGNVGMYSSLTIGTDGNPLVAYYDATNADLKVAHCSNPTCTPFFRRR